MAKNHLFMHPAQPTPSMSPSHSYTIVAPGDDEDSDICPVCDGECTCHKTTVLPHHELQTIKEKTGPLSMAELSIKYADQPLPARPYTSPATPKPSLKIKLTVPPNLLSKRKAHQPTPTPVASTSTSHQKRSSKNTAETTSDFAAGGYDSPDEAFPRSSRPITPPKLAPAPAKKRGRPPKALVAARKKLASSLPTTPSRASPYKPLNPKSAAPGKQTHRRSSSSATKPKPSARQNLKTRATLAARRRKKAPAVSSADESSLSDVDMRAYTQHDDDTTSGHFPTFLSASALSSLSSGGSSLSSDSSLSDFDDDSDIEKEEEGFIVADVRHDKARVRRELLGGDDAALEKKKKMHRNEEWVIRPRKKSVGPSDVEMDVDSDATEDEDEEDEEEDEENAEADESGVVTEGMGMGMMEDEGDETDAAQRRPYVGLATGWSEEDDESSFDADLFFAHLYHSSSSSDEDEGSGVPRLGPAFSMAEDGDQSDVSLMSECTEGGGSMRTGRSRAATLESLPFEVTESWDGQVVFTNGVRDGQGIVDYAFEADAERLFVLESSASPTAEDDTTDASPTVRRRMRRAYMHPSAGGFGFGMSDEEAEMDSDVDMPMSTSACEGDSDDGGYLEEDGDVELGDTTDEELVGDDDLPNERAMALFRSPLNLSAINPLSTVSSPVASTHHSRRRRGRGKWASPLRAADILAGKVTMWDSEAEEEHAATRGRPLVRASSSGDGERDARRPRTPTGPRRGIFVPSTDTKQAVIGDQKNGAEVPSPHPRFKGRRRAASRYSVDHLLRKHLLRSINSGALSNSVTSIASTATDSPRTDETSSVDLQLLLSSTASVSDDVLASALSTPGGMQLGGVDHQLHQPAQVIQLDDVLEASFLDDDSDHAGAHREGSAAIPGTSHNDDGGHDAAEKNLNRWDLISVGAFRQRHTPASSADFGNAMKSSPMSMLWQQNSTGPVGGGGGASSSSGVAGPSGKVSSSSVSAPSTVRRSSGGSSSAKHAKRRRLMMMSASTMSSPLILPLGGDRTPTTPGGASASMPLGKHSPDSAGSNKHQNQNHDRDRERGDRERDNKSRKETRRERKLLKKKGGFGSVQQKQQHPGHHQFHSHHHHPNAKTRGVGSAQRVNFFAASVPPLNL